MFSLAADLYDAPPAWWETDCVRYGWVQASSADVLESNLLTNRPRLSYKPVRSRLTSLMGSYVVRLTDRKYMMRLASRLQEDYEAQQRVRIEQRKLRVTSDIPELRKSVSRLLLKATRRRRQCAPKFSADAAKKCKQLPQLLLAGGSESRSVGILNAR